jgi:hypothetical protein
MSTPESRLNHHKGLRKNGGRIHACGGGFESKA